METAILNAKTHGEIRELKRDWLGDPCWDIEDTEGFEMYADELRDFRLMMEKRWEAEANQRLLEMASALGCSPQLAKKFVDMRDELDRLAEIVLTLEAERDVKAMGL